MRDIRTVKLYTLNEQDVCVAPMQKYIQQMQLSKIVPLEVFLNPEGDEDICVEQIDIPINTVRARVSGGVQIDEYVAFHPRVRQLIADEFEHEIDRLNGRIAFKQHVIESWEESVKRFHELPWYKRMWFALKKRL